MLPDDLDEILHDPDCFRGSLHYGIRCATGELLDLSEIFSRPLIIPPSRMPADCDVSESEAFQVIKEKLVRDISKRYPLAGGNVWTVWLAEEGPGYE